LHLELIDGVGESGALQYARKAGDDAQAATGNGGAILAIPNIAGAEFSGAAADRGQPGVADERVKFAAEDLVSPAQFAAAASVIAEIETASGAFVAKDGDAGLTAELVAGKLGGEYRRAVGRTPRRRGCWNRA
jgi:hypothetical protein